MTLQDIALQIFCAYLSRPNAPVSAGDHLGEKQVQIAFELARSFVKVRDEQV